MSAANEPHVMDALAIDEGGKVDDKRDPGGRTNRGVTQSTFDTFRRSNSLGKKDVWLMTDAEHDRIYHKNYWQPTHCDDLPDGFDNVVMNAAVHSGLGRGAKWFQVALGVTADGRIGPATILAAKKASDGVAVIQRACAVRMKFLTGLTIWKTYSKGFTNRMARVEAVSVRMWLIGAGQQIGPRINAESKVAKNTAGKQSTGAATSAGGGAATTTLPDLPDWSNWALLGIGLAIAVFLALKAYNNNARARAYLEALK